MDAAGVWSDAMALAVYPYLVLCPVGTHGYRLTLLPRHDHWNTLRTNTDTPHDLGYSAEEVGADSAEMSRLPSIAAAATSRSLWLLARA
jgi:hypothetical protein